MNIISQLKIERDKAAVVAGLTLHQNNGLVEGKVNKLKLIKRMGYGRAGFARLASKSSSCPVTSSGGELYSHAIWGIRAFSQLPSCAINAYSAWCLPLPLSHLFGYP